MDVSTAGCGRSRRVFRRRPERAKRWRRRPTAAVKPDAVFARVKYHAPPAASAMTANPKPAHRTHLRPPSSGSSGSFSRDRTWRAGTIRASWSRRNPPAPHRRHARRRCGSRHRRWRHPVPPSSSAPRSGSSAPRRRCVPLTAEAICFSESASANTTTTALGACCVARCTSARTSLVVRASITSICPRLVLASCATAVSIESTGLTDACPPSASPSSSRKSSRSVSAVRSTVGRCVGDGVSADFRHCPTRDSEAHSMLDWPLLVSPRSTKSSSARATALEVRQADRAPTRLITHAKRGFMEHIARRTRRSAAVHSNDRPVRETRQRIAETLKQCSLSGLARSSAGRRQNIRCPHARGPVRTFSPHPGTSGHAFCSIPDSAASDRVHLARGPSMRDEAVSGNG